MREIKLQAWQKQRKELFEVSAIQFASPTKPGFVVKKALSGGLNIETWTLDEVELREFTGLMDKHGKEIYEGDICRMESGYPANSNYEVYWNEDRWGLQELRPPHCNYDNGDYYHGDAINWLEAEIIGNVHEHPELVRQP